MKLTVVLILAALPMLAQHAQGDKKRNPAMGNPAAIAAGEKAFNESCAVCHGPGGNGGRGPNLATGRVAWHASTDEGTYNAIKNGIPKGGMPASGAPEEKLWQLTAYVRSLREPAADGPISGNAAIGQEIFWGKGGCNECHSLRGRGGKIGPDLSDVGGSRPAVLIRQAIVTPGENGSKGFEKATVKLKNGQSYEGVLKNRNNYSLQMLDARGQLHLLWMRDVQEINLAKRSVMPMDFPNRFSAAEIDGLVAYLSQQSVRPVAVAGN